MNKILSSLIVFTILLIGCARISPLSPQLEQKLDNTQGQIDELKNNQNGIMLDLMKLHNENKLNADNIRDAQQGILNLKGNENSGIQILQGDGVLMLIFCLGALGMFLIYHYRSKSLKHEKTAEILAQQIALYNDVSLDDQVFLSALNTDVERDVYHLMVKSQSLAGRKP